MEIYFSNSGRQLMIAFLSLVTFMISNHIGNILSNSTIHIKSAWQHLAILRKLLYY